MQQPNLDIMEFVESQILPRYAAFGKSHGLSHVQHVIRNSRKTPLTANSNMCLKAARNSNFLFFSIY